MTRNGIRQLLSKWWSASNYFIHIIYLPGKTRSWGGINIGKPRWKV